MPLKFDDIFNSDSLELGLGWLVSCILIPPVPHIPHFVNCTTHVLYSSPHIFYFHGFANHTNVILLSIKSFRILFRPGTRYLLFHNISPLHQCVAPTATVMWTNDWPKFHSFLHCVIFLSSWCLETRYRVGLRFLSYFYYIRWGVIINPSIPCTCGFSVWFSDWGTD